MSEVFLCTMDDRNPRRSDDIDVAPRTCSGEMRIKSSVSNTYISTDGEVNSECLFSIQEAGPEMDEIVVKHWRQMWIENGVDESLHHSTFDDITLQFVESARRTLEYKTFVAVETMSNKVIGSVSCQRWSGPVPLSMQASALKLGTVWAVYVHKSYRRQGIAARMMERVISYFHTINCHKALLLYASDEGRRVYSRLGFDKGNMLLHDLDEFPADPNHNTEIVSNDSTLSTEMHVNHQKGHQIVSFSTPGQEADATIVEHWKKMWAECGIPESHLQPDFEQITTNFITHARRVLQYQTFTCQTETGQVVGSVSAQVWNGVIPDVLQDSVFKLGAIWNVYVDPLYRKNGIATRLMRHVLVYLKKIGCTRAILVYASDNGKRLYKRIGFKHSNAMVLDLQSQTSNATSLLDETAPTVCANQSDANRDSTPNLDMEEMVNALRSKDVSGTDQYLQWLLRATPELLDTLGDDPTHDDLRSKVVAVQKEYGVFIDPNDNWFTQNLNRFGGGFDMKKLANNPSELASKFDRLSSKYDVWTVGNKSVVMKWIAECVRQTPSLVSPTAHPVEGERIHSSNTSGMKVLDVACGIGLPGHTLRLNHCTAHITGTDVSGGMIRESEKRRCYDSLFVGNANHGFNNITNETYDVIICTGAMELLDRPFVLKEFARILKSGGALWVSFQWVGEDGKNTSTAHQGIEGITLANATSDLQSAGFEVSTRNVTECPCAFMTPRDGTLLPVPYLFFCVTKS